MDRFLVNMAIVRVNWNKKGSDILDNYIPLVHETLSKMESDIFSSNEFKEQFLEIAEFKVPTGAILSLLKRATKKYELLEKQPRGEYKIIRNNIQKTNFSQIRDGEQRKYNSLIKKFVEYCKVSHEHSIEEENASNYFFEVLYEIAPALFLNINEAEKYKDVHSDKHKFLVAKFVSYSNKYDQASFEAILSFVRGSMLTETFYYSQNLHDIANKPLRKTVVYFDTQLLVRILGFSQREFCVPCEELLEILIDLDVKVRCFNNTLEELRGIFFAALNSLDQYGRLTPNSPGDVFDFINQESITPSDLLVLMNSLETKLNEKGIYVEDKPEIIECYSIDENNLSDRLSDAFEGQSEKARFHDIDCLQAVFQLREGKRQDYLDKCKAIFITTNSRLARLSTIFFNDHYGHSNAPVCMSDHVFTSLVWMKSVKKTANLPKSRLVATCYSALLPSESLWSDYLSEVNRLKDKGEINEDDYHVLIHSMTARENLMDQAFSYEDNLFGSVENILNKAKQKYTEDIGTELKTAQEQLNYKNNEIEEQNQKIEKQNKHLKKTVNSISKKVSKILFYLMIFVWVCVLLYGLLYTNPQSINEFKKFNIQSLVFLMLLIITLLNLIFGFKIINICNTTADKLDSFISRKLISLLTSEDKPNSN